MKRAILIAILMMALGTYATQANATLQKSGSIIVILDGRVALSLETGKCGPYKGPSHLLIQGPAGNTILVKTFINEIVTVSSLPLPKGNYKILLRAGDCHTSSSFSK